MKFDKHPARVCQRVFPPALPGGSVGTEPAAGVVRHISTKAAPCRFGRSLSGRPMRMGYIPASHNTDVDKETKAAFADVTKALNSLRSDMESGMESMRADMATKADLAELRRNIRQDMREELRDIRGAVKRLEGHTGLEAR